MHQGTQFYAGLFRKKVPLSLMGLTLNPKAATIKGLNPSKLIKD